MRSVHNNMLPEYKQYLLLRNTASADGEARRLRLKADLAREVSNGEGEWYLSRLMKRVHWHGSSYGEVASQLADSMLATGRREPSLAEAVMATKELAADYQELSKKLLPSVRTLVRVGSTSWAENYDIRRDKTNPSDLDVEALVDDLSPERFTNIPKLPEAVAKFKSHHELGSADYMAFTYTNDAGRPVSLHIMPTKTFTKACTKDYFTTPQEHLITEFRTKPKSKTPNYELHFTNGVIAIFPSPVTKVEDGQLTQTPLMAVTATGDVALGVVMDKYFAFPKTEGDSAFFEENINQFKQKLADHLPIGAKFSSLPARKGRMPYWVLQSLDEQQAILGGKL